MSKERYVPGETRDISEMSDEEILHHYPGLQMPVGIFRDAMSGKINLPISKFNRTTGQTEFTEKKDS